MSKTPFRQSDESGQFEIYVRPFPNVEDDRVQVSNAGGVSPLWSADGRELFYLQPENPRRMMSIAVDPDGPALSISGRTPLLGWPYFWPFGGGRPYDVAPDGSRFLTLTTGVAGGGHPSRLVLVQNWFSELERLVPTN